MNPPEKIIVGPISGGLQKDKIPTYINNDSFPILTNAQQFRGRVRRKRGTEFISRFQRFFDSSSSQYSAITTITLSVMGAGNLITGFSLDTSSSIIPGSVTINSGSNAYTDPNKDGTLTPSGSINYATGAIVIAAEANNAVSAIFTYYPGLPVLGLRDFVNPSEQYPSKVGFDTKRAYNLLTINPFTAYDVSFYKNPPDDGTIGYAHKTALTPLTWNGQNYQQFWTVTYEGALWVTNGLTVPFTTTNLGMQFQKPTDPVVVGSAVTPTVITFTVGATNLVIGDFVFANEFTTSGTAANAASLNFQTGFVTATNTGAGTVTVTFPNAKVQADTYSNGLLQFLTNRSEPTKDCIRWYDGDPTLGTGLGFVNFTPPLSQSNFSIGGLPPAIYYLVGAKIIFPYKDRLIFIGPVVQTSTSTTCFYLQDTVIYSQNGTPYYTASWNNLTNDPRVLTTGTSISLLTPVNRTSFPAAWFEDSTGFGGYISTGLNQQLISVSPNEDSLIIGVQGGQVRIVSTGNDIVPFNFYLINAEQGTSSTFSVINMDEGVLSRGARGYIATNQTSTVRIDPAIPDEVFEVRLINNGAERFTAARDFINEWIYFTYPSNRNSATNYVYNTQTLLYNYRDNSWSTINECYTAYGQFTRRTGLTWRNVGTKYATWGAWNVPWSSGRTTVLQPEVIGGNQQGFILAKTSSLSEGTSLAITGFTGSLVTCRDHCLNDGDFIVISGCLGTIGALVNGKIFSVGSPINKDSFDLNALNGSGTYFGGGLITRAYKPFIQTKQFPVAWQDARKTRLGVQRYLLSKTDRSQIQLLIYLSQNQSSPYNDGPIVPANNSQNNALIYSTVLYTCPESTNLGLTPANTNLMTPPAVQQSQIWHRINTSLIGDSVQLGFTMSDEQMRMVDENGGAVNLFAEIELHGFILEVYPSQLLV